VQIKKLAVFEVTYGNRKAKIGALILKMPIEQDLLLGLNDWDALGLHIAGLQKPILESLDNNVGVEKDREIHNDDPEFTKEQEEFMVKLRPAIAKNQALDPLKRCTLDYSIVELPMTDETPIFTPQYKLQQQHQVVVDSKVQEWVTNGVIKEAPLGCKWNSPLIVTSKKDEEGNKTKHIVCVDYRRVNEKLKEDQYPIPLIRDILDGFADCEYFLSIDLKDG
jgi:hypothetical protein